MPLSHTIKMDGIASWSLQAFKTCPGARNRDGSPVEVCAGCYARNNMYRIKNVKRLREQNRQEWKKNDWVQVMTSRLSGMEYFRWFDSGDIYCKALAEKILAVMKATPWCRHWLPTRSYKFEKIERVLREMEELPNVAVRRSGDYVNRIQPGCGSVVITSANEAPADVFLCRANPKCGDCRACWDKSIPVIAYSAKGSLKNAAPQQINVRYPNGAGPTREKAA